MRRLLLVLVVFAALPAFAIHPDVSSVGVLRFSTRYADSDDAVVARAIQDSLRAELSRLGFQAFDAGVAFEGLPQSDVTADLFVDVVGSRESAGQIGNVGVGTHHVWADLGLIVSSVAAEVRLYDGRTLQLVRSYQLDKRSLSITPTGAGVGGHISDAAVWVAVPAMRWFQTRSAARDVAIDAAKKIAGDFRQ